MILVAYPKSGLKWLQWMVCAYLHGDVDWLLADEHVPNCQTVDEIEGHRVIRTHAPVDFAWTTTQRPVVHVVRDPRDVCVSYFHHMRKWGDIPASMEFPAFVDRFNAGTIYPHQAWSEYVRRWENRRAITVRYEQVLARPHHELLRVLELVDESDHARSMRAVRLARFERMRDLELIQHHHHVDLARSDPTQRTMRTGGAGGWRDWFDDGMLAAFMDVHGVTMRGMGYA